jgi:hypothetical protein
MRQYSFGIELCGIEVKTVPYDVLELSGGSNYYWNFNKSESLNPTHLV